MSNTLIGAEAVIRWHDEDDVQNVYISFGEERFDEKGDVTMDEFGVLDKDIFFYGSPAHKEDYVNGTEDWFLIKWDFVFRYEDPLPLTTNTERLK